jgi:hypothetical protein
MSNADLLMLLAAVHTLRVAFHNVEPAGRVGTKLRRALMRLRRLGTEHLISLGVLRPVGMHCGRIVYADRWRRLVLHHDPRCLHPSVRPSDLRRLDRAPRMRKSKNRMIPVVDAVRIVRELADTRAAMKSCRYVSLKFGEAA